MKTRDPRAWACGSGRPGPAGKGSACSPGAAVPRFPAQAYMNHAAASEANCSAAFAGEAARGRPESLGTWAEVTAPSPGPPDACHKMY